jgi:hypothetical protein
MVNWFYKFFDNIYGGCDIKKGHRLSIIGRLIMASEAQLYYLGLKIRPNCLKFKNIRLDECEKVVLITIVSRLD